MKVRDSGMPEEEWWSTLFDPEGILRAFGVDDGVGNLVDFGCGYGTFALTAAKMVTGVVHGFDIDAEMIETVATKCALAEISNLNLVARDFVSEGTGLPEESVDAALLFNILHHDEPLVLMREAFRILKPNGSLAVIHWNYDASTPRGPSLDIRPRPEQCIAWGIESEFRFCERHDFKPYHYGLLFRKPIVLGS